MMYHLASVPVPSGFGSDHLVPPCVLYNEFQSVSAASVFAHSQGGHYDCFEAVCDGPSVGVYIAR